MDTRAYLIFTVVLCSYFSVQAAVYSPTDDTFIDEYAPNQSKINGTEEHAIVRRMGLVGYELDTLVKFNLSSISSGATIESAKLNLYYYQYSDSSPSGNPVGAYRIMSTWSESTTNWLNRPTYDVVATDSVSWPGSYGWVQWDVTSDVQDFVDGTETNYGWQIMNSAASGNSMIYFRTSDYSDYHPYLEITFRRFYVDQNASGANDGTSWTNAFTTLQAALEKPPTSGDQIWVAKGEYFPDANSLYPEGSGERDKTFTLVSGTAVYGGFAGEETSLGERDWQKNPTILSGDIGEAGAIGDNSYTVVTNNETTYDTILDGFIVTGGNANGSWPNNIAGGMYNDGSAASVANCTFTENFANGSAGGVYNYNCFMVFNNCVFKNNLSDYNGGGVYNYNTSNSTFINCVFHGNSTSGAGGGMYNKEDASPTLINCVFSGNLADYRGGGIYNYSEEMGDECCPTLINCSLSGNTAGQDGGGMYTNNEYHDCEPTLANCIFWGNLDKDGIEQASQIAGDIPVVTYSCIQDDCEHDATIPYPGNNNIDDDPRFVRDPHDGHDGWAVGYDDYGDLRLDTDSPCIDAGDNIPVSESTDLDGHARRIDDPNVIDTGNGTPPIVDMGAYERDDVGYCGDTDYPYPRGDLSGPDDMPDCIVNLYDFAVIARNWLQSSGP